MEYDLADELYKFVESILIPSFSKDRQIEIMGAVSPSCAWELVQDIESHGQWVFSAVTEQFSSTEAEAVNRLLQIIQDIPKIVTTETGMSDPFWIRFNQEVQTSISILEPRISEACSELNVKISALYE